MAHFPRNGGPLHSDSVAHFPRNIHKSQEIDLKKNTGARWERVAYVILGVGLFILLTIYLLPEERELYRQILEWAAVFSAGGLGGYGIGIRRNNRAPQG